MAIPDPPPPPLDMLFREATSVLELATAVGHACLDRRDELKLLEDDADAMLVHDLLKAHMRWLDDKRQIAPGADGTFAHLLEIEKLADAIEKADTAPPIGHFAVLLGLLSPLGRIFEEEDGVVQIERGTPIPRAEREVNNALGPTTPSESTSGRRQLLPPETGFYVFDYGYDPTVPVQLDFSIRKRLDELTWGEEERLPKVATIHPRLGKNGVRIEREEKKEGWFFGVVPTSWDLVYVLEQLRQAAEAGAAIAVLPELCLPESELDVLESALAGAADDLPPLIVGGSVHLEEGEGRDLVRANETRIYLDGERVAHHRKIYPYRLRKLPDGRKLKKSLSEGLTDEPKPINILSGNCTRMAVMICSDLIETKLAVQLEDARVNLLLVPALTPDTGSFNGDVCMLASHCQGASVIVNGDTSLYKGAMRRPFMVMAGVPRPRTPEQSREYRRRFRGGPALGIVDLNAPLKKALRWL